MVGEHRESLMGVGLVWGFWATASFILALSLEIQVNPTIRVGRKSTLNPVHLVTTETDEGDATREAWLIFLMVYWWAVYISILRPASSSKDPRLPPGFFFVAICLCFSSPLQLNFLKESLAPLTVQVSGIWPPTPLYYWKKWGLEVKAILRFFFSFDFQISPPHCPLVPDSG